MRRRLTVTVLAVLLLVSAGSALVVADAATTSDDDKPRHGGSARQFAGYWMGIDPLDGGDSRRGITRNDDRTFSIIGRDTVFTLCDGTDRAVIRGVATVAGSTLVSDDLVITCTSNDATVRLKFRFEVIDRNIARETVARPNGDPVDEITFHRISAP